MRGDLAVAGGGVRVGAGGIGGRAVNGEGRGDRERGGAAEETARLTIRDSLIDCPRVWDGDERPLAVEDCRNRVVFFSSSAEGKLVEDYSLCTYT